MGNEYDLLGHRKEWLMLKRLPKQNGVGLIEVMIGLAIVAVLISLAVPGFRSFIQNSHVRNAADAIQNGLNFARAEAVRRNTNVQFRLDTGSSWTVGCVTAVAACPAVIEARSAAEGSGQATVATAEVVASTNAAVASPVFTTTLVFNGLGKERTLPLANNAVFNISHSSGGACATAGTPAGMRCLRVVVTPGGQVRMCDPARPVTTPPDPQAC
jgi:type IV fimbrial biogenesis protein FimT